MRILVLTPDAPAPIHINGGATRQNRLYKRLIELGHSVTVVAVMPPHVDDFDQQLREEGFDLRPMYRSRSRLRETASALLRRPSLLLQIFTAPVEDLIGAVYWVDLRAIAEQALADGPYDVVCVEEMRAAQWIDGLEFDAPLVLTHHEVKSVQFLEKGARIGGLRGLLWRENARRTLRSERRWIPKFDTIVTMSDTETGNLREIVPELPATFAIGNGADIEAFAAIEREPAEPNVFFTGTMEFPPNAVAAQWLARKVWPAVLEAEPKAQLLIVGRRPSESTRALSDLPGVEMTADVPEILPWFERAAVFALPMLEGGGTRLKLAEAMAAGRPIVSTTNGASGVDVSDGVELLIADTPEEFAAEIVRLLRDPELRVRMGAAGRTKACAKYDWQKLGDEFAAVLEQTVERGPR